MRREYNIIEKCTGRVLSFASTLHSAGDRAKALDCDSIIKYGDKVVGLYLNGELRLAKRKVTPRR